MKSSILSIVRVLCLALAGLCLLAPQPARAAYTLGISTATIEDALRLFFPLRDYASDARLMLREPHVMLAEGAGHIRLQIPVVASIAGEGRLRGHVEVTVGLHYRGPTGEVFLGLPTLVGFDMPGLPAAREAEFRRALTDVLTKTLPLVRIGRVTEADLNHSLEKTVILARRIETGMLRVTIGFR